MEGPTEADVAAQRLESTPAQERAIDRRQRWQAYHEGPQRPGTLVVGVGYAGFAFPHPLPNMNGVAWSARVYKNWYLPDAKLQLSMGSGLNGMHVGGVAQPDPNDPYADPTPVRVRLHHFTAPLEFRFGGPYPDRVFAYGLVGGAVGFAAATDIEGNSAMGFVLQPIVLGIGGYGALGDTNLILGAEARSDFAVSAWAGAPHFDLQLKFGFNFQ